MAVHYNSRIIPEGLVLYLDAANVKSYPGSGTAWSDLSPFKRTATLVGSPTYNSAGYFVFTGSQTVTVANPLTSQSSIMQTWTISAWLNIDDTANQSLVNLNAGLFPSYGANNSLLYLNSGVNDYYTYGGDIGALGWRYVTFRFDNISGYRKIYSNAVDITTSGPNATSTPSGIPSTWTIASNLRGNLAELEVYDRLLSDEQVFQNFTASRRRFGV